LAYIVFLLEEPYIILLGCGLQNKIGYLYKIT